MHNNSKTGVHSRILIYWIVYQVLPFVCSLRMPPKRFGVIVGGFITITLVNDKYLEYISAILVTCYYGTSIHRVRINIYMKGKLHFDDHLWRVRKS